MNLHIRTCLAAAALVAAVVGLSSLRHSSPVPAAGIAKPADAAAVSAARDAKNLALTPDQRTEALNAYKKLPLSFEENRGQAASDVNFLSRGAGYSLFLKSSEAVLSLRNTASNAAEPNAYLRMKLANASAASTIKGIDVLPGKSNYIIGNKTHYATDVSQYKKVLCENVYAGIDMVYYGNQRQLEYDFVVAPGADPSAIRMVFKGSDKIEVDAKGDLAIHMNQGDVTQHKPVMYQLVDGTRKEVAGQYEIVSAAKTAGDETTVGFKIADYDRASKLVIDPVLVYATYYGDQPNTTAKKSDHSGDDIGLAIAIDLSGAAYVVGKTNTYEFPLVGPIETVFDPIDHAQFPTRTHSAPASYHGFITKFTSDGSAIVYSTYLAGSSVDECRGIAVDALGNAYICGATTSSDFPTKFAQHVYSGGVDAFLLKLNPAGNDLVFSTFLGGSADDYANDIALDNAGNVIIVGTTSSLNFVTAHPLQSAFGGAFGTTDAFVAKFSSDGAVNYYSTFLGGTGNETANGVATDSSGNAYITGSTTSTNFPIANPYQVNKGAGMDAFVSKINASGTLLVYSTYLGGDGDEVGNGIAVDATGNAYVTGTTSSANFPTISPTILPVQQFNGGPAGTTDAFVSKFNVFGSSLIFSTYLGGKMNDVGKRVRIDSRNAIYVTGTTTLTAGGQPSQNDFPVQPKATPTDPSANTLQSSHSGLEDAFLTKFNPTGTPLVYSTFIGSGSHVFVTDNGVQNANVPTSVAVYGMAVDNAGNAFLTGSTDGSFYYTFGAYSIIGPNFPVPGEDFPAPHVIEITDVSGNVVPQPAEANAFLNIDENDIIIAKIADNSPIIYSAMSAQATNGVSFNSYTILATNVPQSFDAAGLPPGLSVSTVGGQISGIPTQDGIYSVVLTATNQSGTGSQILIISVSSAKPVMTSATNATANVGSIFQFQFTADNNPAAYALAPVSPTIGLPVGVTLDATTGLLSGIPVVEGTYQFNATASNSNGTSLPQSFTLKVLPAIPVISSPVNVQALLNVPFSYAITATGNPQSYGATPNLGPLPAVANTALTESGTTVTVATGAPHNLAQGQSITIANVVPASYNGVYTVLSVPTSTTFTYLNPTSGLAASTTPGTVAANILVLPIGLQLNTVTGFITGSPNALGFYKFKVTATNAGGTGSQDFNLTVIPALVPVISSSSSATGIYNEPFTFQITASNNPLVYGVIGNLPAGLTLDDQTGIISGIITDAVLPFNVASPIGAVQVGTTVTITTAAPHGLIPGDVVVVSDVGVAGYNGTYTVIGTPTTTMFTYTDTNSLLGPTGGGTSTSTVVLTPVSVSELGNTVTVTTPVAHGFGIGQSFDMTGFPANTYNGTFAVASVLSATTFTYFNPINGLGNLAGGTVTALVQFMPVAATAAGNTVTITTLSPHGLMPGQGVTISNFNVGGYNGNFTIATTPTATTFTYADPAAQLPPSGGGVFSKSSIFNLTQTAANVAGQGTKPLVITLIPPKIPVVTSPATATAVVNAAFEYDILAQNHPTSYSTSALPAGLTLNTVTGAITGAPTTAGVYPITISASNSGGTGSATLTLTVSPQPSPIIVSPNQANGFVGIPFSYQIVATANPTGFSAAPMPLPASLTISPTGLISGTPSATGVFTITLTATNPVGSGNKVLTLTITNAVAPTFTSPLSVNGIDGTAFTYRITASGIGPIIFTAGGLPSGLTLAGDTIVGTPTAGVTSVSLMAFSPATNPTTPGGSGSNLSPLPTAATLTINISPSAAAIVNSVLTATGTVGQPFSYIIQASGSAPLVISTSALPSGLTLVGNTIQGTPTAAAVTKNGPFAVTLSANNPYSATPSTVTLFITINAAVPKFTSSAFVIGTDGIPFRYVVAATGTQPITYTSTTLPAGLSLTGNVISGTPTPLAIGLNNVTLTATNPGGSTTMVLGIEIDPAAPVLTIPASVTGSAGVPFTFTLTATGSPQIDYIVSNLPPGLVVDIDKIVGIPTTPGTYNTFVSATNAGGTDNRALTIVINPAPPSITAALINGFDGVPLVPYTLIVTGAQPITFSATGLPTGVTINSQTGIISGTPSGFGNSVATVTATNVGGIGTQQVVFNILPSKPTITSLLVVQATPGVPFTYVITATGTPTITFQVSNLPPGLSATGNMITGTPNGSTGLFTVSLTALNNYGSDTQTLDINIQQTPPTITNQTLAASGQQFSPFTFTLTATGSPPISFTATPLPAGLSINAGTGVISGTPTVFGTFNVPVTATNLFGTDSGKTLVITIGKAPPKITSPLVAEAGFNEPFTYTITATGSATIVFGASNLPPGLTVDLNTGIISGTPTAVGVFPVTILAANTAGSDTKTLVLTVTANPPTITSPLFATTGTIVPFTYTITATGSGPLTYTATGLPSGLTFSGNQITGTALLPGVYNITLTATNPLGTDTKILVLTVSADSDNDGFPDDLEVYLGTDPTNPLSNPFTGGTGTIRVLNVTAESVKLNFQTSGVDTITLKGTLQLNPGFNPVSQPAVIYVSGVAAIITLNVHAPSSVSALTVKPTRALAGGTASFSASFGKGDFKAKMAVVGMTNSNVLQPRSVSTLVIVFLNNTLYKSDKALTYTARAGKSGTAKQSN